MSTPKKLMALAQDAGAKGMSAFKNKHTHGHSGLGAFVPALQRLTLHYHHPSLSGGQTSRPMVEFIRHDLPKFARDRPWLEIRVVPRQFDYPELVGEYRGEQTRYVRVHKFDRERLVEEVKRMADSSGRSRQKYKENVVRESKRAASVLEPWSPFVDPRVFRP
ncbi:hypothetical protein BDK51DRAFT_29009 [Blyttiomyces helicus]|uniref:Large ribosomal subunit protein mL43 n=1 Tax=Blyttiomyces helicus TaxID=388810 RepID=A0A4P9W2N8_9FUNG|nr:hypothetical protein BDK51DRAFT_29009 [Blyttiomyces helicus]|eukprot:RKO85645.1 hypothetical protein BDK51DRAFT_29009 [Blyttiomyces helicus]